jgi:serine/threonine protein phosphatase PrpC
LRNTNAENQTVPLSFDHKPNDEEERKRIIKAGHSVMMDRVDGSLALSRAFGDLEYKDRDDLTPQ